MIRRLARGLAPGTNDFLGVLQHSVSSRSIRNIASVTDAEAATRTIVDNFARGDLDAISSAVAEEYVDHQGLGDIETRGPSGFRQVVEAVRRDADVRVTIQDIVAAKDKAAVRLRWRGVNPSGRTVTRETLDLLRFVEGRLVEHWGAQLFRRES
jgi:predicted ester cyclase